MIVHSRSVSSYEWKIVKWIYDALSPGSCQHGLILNLNFSIFNFKAWQLQAPSSATHTYNVVARLATLYVYFENIYFYIKKEKNINYEWYSIRANVCIELLLSTAAAAIWKRGESENYSSLLALLSSKSTLVTGLSLSTSSCLFAVH